jgi:hypothetical protein
LLHLPPAAGTSNNIIKASLQQVFDETTVDFEEEELSQRSTNKTIDSGISELSHQALRLALNSCTSDDDESVSSFFIPGITQKAKCLSPAPRRTASRDYDAFSRRKNGLKKRMMSVNELTPRQHSKDLLEEFSISARRQQLLERSGSGAVSMSKIERTSTSKNNSKRRQAPDNARYLDDLKEEMQRFARNQKKLLRKQKEALRALKKM